MKLLNLFLFFVFLISGITSAQPNYKPDVKGELKKWHTINFVFDGPQCSETNFKPNPFLDFRFEVTFTKGTRTFKVPGFFAADGEAAETSALSGNKWQVNFVPDEAGTWTYNVSFRTGKDIAISTVANEGTSLPPHAATGSFIVAAANPKAPGFISKGRLVSDGGQFLKFSETNKYFIKNGADSPENFLAFVEFDQTYRYGNKAINREGEANPKESCHKFEPHVKDWKEGDPLWQGTKGKGIIGAINYLADQGVNSQYMLLLNIQGDGKDVWPYSDHNERYRFDCSKLDQWEIVFNHLERKGIMLHFVLQETENECMLDGGHTEVQRKLYLREMIARFGHHLGVCWNIGEENGPADWTPVGQTDQMRKDMANYMKSINPYPNYIAIHTHADNHGQDKVLKPLIGFESIDGVSMQIGNIENVNSRVSHFSKLSADSKKPWIIMLDEIGPAHKGVMPDEFDAQHDTVRTYALWGSLMAGAGGAEWYFGYRYPHNDLMCEDFRSRELWWKQTKIATDFFTNNLPFEKMKPANELINKQGNFCLANEGAVYIVYLSKADNVEIKLPAGNYSLKWFNPRVGGKLIDGTLKILTGGKNASIGLPPVNDGKDWVAMIKKM